MRLLSLTRPKVAITASQNPYGLGATLLEESHTNPSFSQPQHVPGPRREDCRYIADKLVQASSALISETAPRVKPLNAAQKEIRLLKVYAGKDLDPLRCTLHYVLLDSNTRPSYETISYVWGETVPKVIEVDRLPTEVPSSAARVIHRMRLPDCDRLLWIDAICIDQRDPVERNSQVALMGQIYRNSSRNLIWMGKDRGSAAMAHKALQAILKNIREQTNNMMSFFGTLHNANVGQFGRGKLLDRKIDLTGLHDLFESPWWSRLWVAQEATLAPSNLCYFGPAVWPLAEILQVSIWLWWNRDIVPVQTTRCPGVEYGHRLYYFAEHQTVPRRIFNAMTSSLTNLTVFWGDLQCRDPRDYIYAVLGVWEWGLQKAYVDVRGPSIPIVPDYKSMKEVVFQQATRAMIEEDCTLQPLMSPYVNSKDPEPLDMASWALRFDRSRNRKSNPVCAQFFKAHNNERAIMSTFNREKDPNVLTLTGICIGVVSKVARDLRLPAGIETMDGLQSLAMYIREFVDMLGPGPPDLDAQTSDDPRIECAMTLIGGLHREDRRSWWQDVVDCYALCRCLDKHKNFPTVLLRDDTEMLDLETQGAIHYLRAAYRAFRGRRLFFTRDGQIGLGHVGLCKGDIVTILHGGPMPIVLRPLKNGKYIYVGECYMHRVMDGQAVRGAHRATPVGAFEVV